ncbi:MAG: lytic transglycosylase domain-containing protein, partial [Candidatus Rokuibacteriota bacterium]
MPPGALYTGAAWQTLPRCDPSLLRRSLQADSVHERGQSPPQARGFVDLGSRGASLAYFLPTAGAGGDATMGVPRQLLGLGVVLVTIIPAYAASRMTTAHTQPPSVYALADGRDSGLDYVVGEVAARYRVPKNLVMAVIAVESQFDPLAVSSRGARGLMQLMPATAQILGVNDPFDPRENIEAGVRHLRALMDRFDNNVPLALAAYNAGAKAVI